MERIQTGILSLVKRSIGEPWKMTFTSPIDSVKKTVTLGKNNGVEVGPRFIEVLSSIERYNTFPRTVMGEELESLGMATKDSFIIHMLSNEPAYVEIGFKHFRRFRIPSTPKVRGIHGEKIWTTEEILADKQMEDAPLYTDSPSISMQSFDSEPIFSIQQEVNDGAGTDPIKSEITDNRYLVAGKVTSYLDGDTIEFLIERVGERAAWHENITVGATIKVRFAGLNTPETADHGLEEGNNRNVDYCKAYNVTPEAAFLVGTEAMNKTRDFLGGAGYVIVDLDSEVAGMPRIDKYGRFVSAVYKTEFATMDDVFAGTFTAKSANKMLLGTKSTVQGATQAPLAIPYYWFIDNQATRLPVSEWLYELGIRKVDNTKIGEDIAAKEAEKKDAANPIEEASDGYVVEYKHSDSASNQLDFFYALDDRIDTLYPDGEIDHRVRIGDVMLIIPPLAIDVNRVSSISKIKTLRTKSSMITKGGSSATTLTLQLYFHDLDAINGYIEKMHPDKDRNYYMDGLRPLIAQFKKAPFLPIDNKYINETLGVHSVALVNLSVQTVPGFPHSLSATLTLAKFDHTAYMPQTTFLGDVINYPMLRWFYQEPLRDDVTEENRNPYRTYLKPIPSEGLSNDFKFLTAIEDQLAERKQAIQDLRNMTNPLIAEERFENPTTGLIGSGGDGSDVYTQLGKEFKDGVAAQKVLDQYNRVLKIKQEGRWPVFKRKEDNGISEENLISVTAGIKPKHKAIWNEIYGDSGTDKGIKGVSHYAPFGTWIHWSETRTALGTAPAIEWEYWPESDNGSIRLRLYGQKNIELFDAKYIESTKSELTTVIVPGKELGVLNQIIQRGKQAEDRYLDGIDVYNQTKAVVEATEGHLDLIEYAIEGDLICTALTVMYENQFSNIQLQGLESPSFQFLGSQDPYVQVSFEADEFAVRSLREMLEQTEDFSRMYRTGITSGFLGIENHLVQLFGITTIMPETMQIRTVPGFPGRYQVDMTLCGFNKTQKRTEQLEGISSIEGDNISTDSREASNFDEAIDNSIIEFNMRDMEVYPDMELPTYHELTTDLPYIGAGVQIYENRIGGKYVDPDFYMATPVTFRELIREQSKLEQTVTMQDFTGVEMQSKSKSGNLIDGDAAMWDILNSLDSRTKKIDPTFSWSGTPDQQNGGDSNSEALTFASTEVETYVKDPEQLKVAPSYDEWKTWFKNDPGRQRYAAWLEDPNPKEWEVYTEIYKLVDSTWVANGYAYNDKDVSLEDAAWGKIAYASREDLWRVNYNYLASADPALLGGEAGEEEIGEISLKDYKTTNSLPPRERIANLVKSVLHSTSRWKQFYASGTPLIDSKGNACGIGGVPLTSEATNLTMAKRLIWDWRFNIAWSVQQLLDGYIAALTKKDIRWQSCPWDWMITTYATGTVETELESPFWVRVNAIHEAYYLGLDKRYSTPTSEMSIEVMQQKEVLNPEVVGLINGDKDSFITDLLATGYTNDKKDGKTTEEWLNAQTSDKLRSTYERWMGNLFSKEVSDNPAYADIGEGAAAAAAGQALVDDKNNKSNQAKYPYEYNNYSKYMLATQYVAGTAAARLVNQTSPQDIFPDMFVDMIRYDHRMRMLRAFPTFQLILVDEGRWMTNYRLWDNLYGFNAITSMDIHKNRKIAADTAVIEMTNVYSNLTSRSLDTSYGDWDYKFWDNLVWGNPNEKMLEARKELLSSLLLQTGARIHLRMGYGSNVVELPVVFNGTITEMNTGEVITIVAQGDGVELGNVISGDPGDDNKSFLKGVTEPRDLICELLTSKGNWFKDVINYATDGSIFKENPLGIQHFGQPAGGDMPQGNLHFFNEDYGESAQNIYSSSGVPTFSQWTYADGSSIPFSWDTPVLKWAQPGDEQNLVLPFYNNTPWNIFQTCAYCSTDYIAAVHPFEMRSTLFFGKPYWRLAYKYDSHYEYNKEQKNWTRYRDLEHRKPYSQVHLFDSYMDIVGNSIKATEDGVYTNVIVNYKGKQSITIYADYDIRFDKQKTTIIDADIVSRADGLDFWTSEKQAMYYGISAVRDYMKDMYKGELLVLGDPTIKPYDMCYMNDTMYDMNGNFLVKGVTHHFSLETGFVTSVQPDALVVSDDLAMLSLSNWAAALGARACIIAASTYAAARMLKKVLGSSYARKAITLGKSGATSATQLAISKIADFLPDDDEDVKAFKGLAKQLRDLKINAPERKAIIDEMKNVATKVESKLATWEAEGLFVGENGVALKGKGSLIRMKRTISAMKQTTNALTDGAKAFKYIRAANFGILNLNPITLIANAVVTWATETLAEKYRRNKASMQACLMMPLMYQGRQYTAGINGHKGMVVGDPAGKLDGVMQGLGIDGVEGQGGFTDLEWLGDTLNFLTGDERKDYSISEDDIRNGKWAYKDGAWSLNTGE